MADIRAEGVAIKGLWKGVFFNWGLCERGCFHVLLELHACQVQGRAALWVQIRLWGLEIIGASTPCVRVRAKARAWLPAVPETTGISTNCRPNAGPNPKPKLFRRLQNHTSQPQAALALGGRSRHPEFHAQGRQMLTTGTLRPQNLNFGPVW